MMRIGRDFELVSEKRNRRETQRLKADRKQSGTYLLAGCNQHVGLARIGRIAKLVGKLEKTVRLTRHRGHHYHNTISVFVRASDTLGHRLDPLNRADGSSTVLLYNKRHRQLFALRD